MLSFCLTAALIWAPTLAQQFRRRALAAVALRLATVAAALAILPIVLPYDHLFPVDAHAAREEEAVHEAHCHVGLGSCADAPLTSGAGQFLSNEPLLPEPAFALLLMVLVTSVLVGRSVRPVLRPPLHASSF